MLHSKSTEPSGGKVILPKLQINVISDLHHCMDPSIPRWMPGDRYNAEHRLECVLRKAAENRADITLLTGDVVDRGHEASYQDFDRRLRASGLLGNVFTTPGNHDRRGPLSDVVRSDAPTDRCIDGEKTHYIVQRNNHMVIVLDSAPVAEFGTTKVLSRAEIGSTGREWLAQHIDAIPVGSVAWIFTHYPAHNFGLSWIREQNIIQDGAELHDVLVVRQAKIGGVFSGHLHHRYAITRDGIKYSSLAPASVPLTVIPSGEGPKVIRDPDGVVGFETLTLGGRGEYVNHAVHCEVTPFSAEPSE